MRIRPPKPPNPIRVNRPEGVVFVCSDCLAFSATRKRIKECCSIRYARRMDNFATLRAAGLVE
jgi:hypothetical protein